MNVFVLLTVQNNEFISLTVVFLVVCKFNPIYKTKNSCNGISIATSKVFIVAHLCIITHAMSLTMNSFALSTVCHKTSFCFSNKYTMLNCKVFYVTIMKHIISQILDIINCFMRYVTHPPHLLEDVFSYQAFWQAFPDSKAAIDE